MWKESELLTALMGAAIAQELIQPLAAIINYVKAAERFLSGNPSALQIENARAAMEKAAEQTVRAGTIIRYLRDYLERQESEKANEDINQVILGALEYHRAGARDNVQVGLDLAPSLPPVRIDRIQIQQLLLYLVRSAGEGALDTEPVAVFISSAPRQGHVEIQVRNRFPRQGHPVRAFLPVEQGGLGIGLKICQSILNANGGSIATWDEGRAFEIRLKLGAANA